MSMTAYPTYQESMDVDLIVNPTRLTITHRGPLGEGDVVLAFVWSTGEVSFHLTEAQRCQLIAHLERNGPSIVNEPDDTIRDMSGYTAADYDAGRDNQP